MAQRELFSGITSTTAHRLLHEAFYDWSHGTYPEATCIGDVVALSGLLDVARTHRLTRVIETEV